MEDHKIHFGVFFVFDFSLGEKHRLSRVVIDKVEGDLKEFVIETHDDVEKSLTNGMGPYSSGRDTAL